MVCLEFLVADMSVEALIFGAGVSGADSFSIIETGGRLDCV
jgi:hypothetical protein